MKELDKPNFLQTYYDLEFCIKAPHQPQGSFKDERWDWDDDLGKVSKVCVSDAHTHIERLVFPAWWAKNSETGERRLAHDFLQISGCHTMIIHGGDSKKVYEPEVYARHIRRKYGVLK